jgi:hypothetical protein
MSEKQEGVCQTWDGGYSEFLETAEECTLFEDVLREMAEEGNEHFYNRRKSCQRKNQKRSPISTS